jgi:hypothetical protein
MSGIFDLTKNKIILILILFSICGMNECRFVWDFGSYCLNHCANIKFRLSAVSICSCQWISSNHRQSTFNKMSHLHNDDSNKMKTFLIK